MRAGGYAPAFFGLAAGFALVAPCVLRGSLLSPRNTHDAPVASLAVQPSARRVLATLARARIPAPYAPAPLAIKRQRFPTETAYATTPPLPTAAGVVFVGSPPSDV